MPLGLAARRVRSAALPNTELARSLYDALDSRASGLEQSHAAHATLIASAQVVEHIPRPGISRLVGSIAVFSIHGPDINP